MSKTSTIKITVNEEYLKLMKRPTKDEYQALRESIVVKGQKAPIIINELGIVIDGHTRFEILENLGILPKYVIEKFDNKEDEMEFVIEANVMKRNYQNKFEYIQACYPLYKLLRARQTIGGDRTKVKKVGTSTAIIGRKIGCNRNLVAEGIWLIENADKEIIRQLEKGIIKISAAYSKLRIHLSENRKILKVTKIKKHYNKKFPFSEKSKQKTILIALTQHEYVLKDELMDIIDVKHSGTFGSNLCQLRSKGYSIRQTTCYTIENTKGLCQKCFVSNVTTTIQQGKSICKNCQESN